MKDPYEVLGISKNATDDEVKAAYRALARKYHPDNFEDSNPLKELATEKMQQINEAYEAIMRMRQSSTKRSLGEETFSSETGSTGSTPFYIDIRNKINRGRIVEAENLLMSVAEDERIAEWHYLISIVYFKRGRVNDAMRELECACIMDPTNMEYQRAKQMFNTTANGYGSTYYGASTEESTTGCSNGCCTCDVCDTCLHLALCDCICECLGGDLIPCL